MTAFIIGAIVGVASGVACVACGFVLGWKTAKHTEHKPKLVKLAETLAPKPKVEFLPQLTPEERKDMDDTVWQKVKKLLEP